MSVYNDGESQLRSIPQSTPSLKDEMRQLNLHGGARLVYVDDLAFGYNLSEKDITTILGLVISRVLDEISGVIADTTIPTYKRAEAITSAIKGLKG